MAANAKAGINIAHDAAGGHEYLYKNGVLVSTQGPATLGTKTTAILTLGANQSPAQDILNGKIGRTIIGSGVPTAEEARLLYSRFQTFGTVKRYYKMDEGTGTVVTDYSSNAVNGSLSDDDYWSTDSASKVRQAASNRIAATGRISSI